MADTPESASSRGSFIGNFESYLRELEEELNCSISSLKEGSSLINREMMLTTAGGDGDGDDDDNAMSEYLRRDRPEFDYASHDRTSMSTPPSHTLNLHQSATFTPMSIRDILRQDDDGDSTIDRFLFALQDTMDGERTPQQTPVKSGSSSSVVNTTQIDFFGSALNDDHYKPYSPQRISATLPSSTEVYVPNNDHFVSYDTSAASQIDDSAVVSQSSSIDDLDLSPAPRHDSARPDDERVLGDFTFYGVRDLLTMEALKKAYCGITESTVPSLRDPTVGKDSSQYSTLYLLECIIRPDIDLPRVMKVLELVAVAPGFAPPLDFYLHRSNHATMSFKEKPSLLSWGEEVPDWDSIDVQVCISRELRQRVVVFQFLRKSATYNNAIKDFLSLKADAPAREIFVKAVRNTLTSSRLCMSDLYTMTASEVCLDGGLDVDFKIKLHHLCRESVWEDMKDDFRSLEEHTKAVEVQCARFMATIDPVYKAHGLQMPAPRLRKKLSEFPLSIDLAALNNVSNIEHEDEESDEEEEEESGEEEEEDQDDDYYERDSMYSDTAYPPLVRRGSVNLASLGKASTFNILSSLGKLSTCPRSEGPSLASKFTPNRKVHHRGRGEESDALAVCLGLLAHCTKILQHRCDVEIAARLQQKNQYTVAILSDLCDYRKLLILHLSRSAEAYGSPLNKVYLKTFAGVDPICTPSQLPTRRELLTPTQPKKGKEENLLMLDDYVEDEEEEGGGGSTGADADTARTVVNYLLDNLISTGTQAQPVAQRPTFAKPVLRSRTMDQVKERLEAYRRSAYDTHGGDSLSTISSAERSSNMLKCLLPQGGTVLASKGGAEVVQEMSDNVIYYCACLVGGVPGKLYLTPLYIGLSYGVLGISSNKELLPLRALSLVAFQAPGSSILAANTLRLAFFGGSREFLVSPMMIECNRLRTMIIDTCDSIKNEEGE